MHRNMSNENTSRNRVAVDAIAMMIIIALLLPFMLSAVDSLVASSVSVFMDVVVVVVVDSAVVGSEVMVVELMDEVAVGGGVAVMVGDVDSLGAGMVTSTRKYT